MIVKSILLNLDIVIYGFIELENHFKRSDHHTNIEYQNDRDNILILIMNIMSLIINALLLITNLIIKSTILITIENTLMLRVKINNKKIMIILLVFNISIQIIKILIIKKPFLQQVVCYRELLDRGGCLWKGSTHR